MKPTVVLSSLRVAGSPDVAGHFWALFHYAAGLRANGCEVWWLERFHVGDEPARDDALISGFVERMERFGFGGRVLLYGTRGREGRAHERFLGVIGEEHTGVEAREAEDVFASADLLMNFNYRIDPELLARFRRTALVDIDPGLTQLWIAERKLAVAPHDVCFTVGERVAQTGARWIEIAPPVALDWWPPSDGGTAFTTVSSWWANEWVRDGREVYDNNKRAAFLDFLELPGLTDRPLELALYGVDGDAELLRRHGWRVCDSRRVARTPEDYRAFIAGSRGELSVAKPSCLRLQNGWVSDRTVCYLASGKPAVVQHTGPSRYFDGGEGVLRFTTAAEAAVALEAVEADYDRHSRAARALAEKHFDARAIASRMLGHALD